MIDYGYKDLQMLLLEGNDYDLLALVLNCFNTLRNGFIKVVTLS